jgi:hypothetical protein
MEACMLACEATIFICSILIVVWDMTVSEDMADYEDMRAYTVLCSMSTFLALGTTLSLLLVPKHVRICSVGDRAQNKLSFTHQAHTISEMLCLLFGSIRAAPWKLKSRSMHE